jgi:hypothetical protein
MDDPFFCPDCRELHGDPAEATLGHKLRCLACADAGEVTEERAAPPIALAA